MVGYQGGGSFRVEQGDLELASATGYGFIIGFEVRPEGFAELLYHRQEAELLLDGGLAGARQPLFDVMVEYWQLGGQANYPRGRMGPFATMTVGAVEFDPRAVGRESEWGLAGTFGLGLKLTPLKSVAVRLQARAFGSLLDGSGGLFCSVSQGCYVSVRGRGVLQGDVSAGLTLSLR